MGKKLPNTAIKNVLKESKAEAPLQMNVIVNGAKVRLEFSRPTKWLDLEPEQAMGMGRALQHCAGLAASNRPIIIPGKG